MMMISNQIEIISVRNGSLLQKFQEEYRQFARNNNIPMGFNRKEQNEREMSKTWHETDWKIMDYILEFHDNLSEDDKNRVINEYGLAKASIELRREYENMSDDRFFQETDYGESYNIMLVNHILEQYI